MKIKMMPADKLIQLKDNISSMQKKYDSVDNTWVLEELGSNAFVDTKFEDSNIDLVISDDSKDDFENVKRLYGALKDVLSDSVATEERLWAGFTLGKYWKYSTTRWKKDSEWSSNGIKSHMFFGKEHPITRNAISRLWWIGRLTYDNTNPAATWKYTQYVCTHQRFIVDFLERNVSNSFDLVKSTVDAILDYEQKHQGAEIDSNKVREIQKYINILGGIYILDCLEYQFLYDKIYTKIESLMSKKD